MSVEGRIRAIWLGLAALLVISAAATLALPQPGRADAILACSGCHDGWFVILHHAVADGHGRAVDATPGH